MSEIKYCQNGECLAEAVTYRGADNWPLCSQCTDAYDAGQANADAQPQYYVSTCPDTGRQFLVETGVDNNIVELTSRNVQLIRENSSLLAHIAEQMKEYRENILPLQTEVGDEYFDYEKNDFLENLLDVMQKAIYGN